MCLEKLKEENWEEFLISFNLDDYNLQIKNNKNIFWIIEQILWCKKEDILSFYCYEETKKVSCILKNSSN